MSTSRATSTIGPDLVIKGRINRCGVLDVYGYIEGGVDAALLRIHPGGRVFGTVRADTAEVYGHLQGDVRIKTLISIGSTGSVSGSVRYGQLALAAGGELSADVRNVPPEIHGDLQVAVRRGRTVPITLSDLDIVDPDDAPENVVITVSGVTAGHIARAPDPGVAIETFTQADIAAGHIVFVSDGSAADAGGFDVAVKDKAGASAAPQRVTVSIL